MTEKQRNVINELADTLVEFWEKFPTLSKERQDEIIQILNETATNLKSETLADSIKSYVDLLKQRQLETENDK